jgi:alkanesulfonate monooxygenase
VNRRIRRHDDRLGSGRSGLFGVVRQRRIGGLRKERKGIRHICMQIDTAGVQRLQHGESEPARALVADKGDVWFINGQPLPDVQALIADARARTRPSAHEPLRFGLSAFVIARETDEAAGQHLDHLFALAAKDAPLREQQKSNIDPKAVMFQTFAQTPRVGSNGGTAAGLVGNYDTVAQRIADFHRAGVELFMLQFQPFETDMRIFAEEVMPRVRRLLG